MTRHENDPNEGKASLDHNYKIRVVLGPKIIPQLFCHNSNVADCEWLTIIYTWTHHFFFTNHTQPRHSCGKKL